MIEGPAPRPTTAVPAGDSRAPLLTSHQIHLLGRMAEAGRVSLEAMLGDVRRWLTEATGRAVLDEARFNSLADSFIGCGFRHPALPLLSRAQRACLDRGRRRLGWSGPVTRAVYRTTTGTASPRLMTGVQFLGLMAMYEAAGVGEQLPAPGFMDRRRAMAMRRKAWLAGVSEVRLRELMMYLGGTLRTRDLDERAYLRVTAALGDETPDPPPPVEGDPGMATQAQVNLLWKRWLEARRGRDASYGKLDVAIRLTLGLSGGVDTLTRAGARAMMDQITASWSGPVDFPGQRLADLPAMSSLKHH